MVTCTTVLRSTDICIFLLLLKPFGHPEAMFVASGQVKCLSLPIHTVLETTDRKAIVVTNSARHCQLCLEFQNSTLHAVS